MRHLAAMLLALLLTGCGGARIAPVDISVVRLSISEALLQLNTAILQEDPISAGQLVSDRFEMDSNVSIRYRDTEWEGTGRGKFREFFSGVFEIHANIFHQLQMTDLELTGDVATARVMVEFNSTRIDRTPPESHLAQGEDYLIFQREGGHWLLINWSEAPELPPHDQGFLSDI